MTKQTDARSFVPSRLAIPADADGVTTEWLGQALAAHGAWGPPRLEGLETEDIGAGAGLFGTVLRCRLTWADDVVGRPETVIVKLQSGNRATVRVARWLGLYRREFDYYRYVAPFSPLGSPSLMYGDFANRSHRFVLVLEDLNRTHNAAGTDGVSPAEAKTAIRRLAHLHSQFWNQKDTHPLSLFPDYLIWRRRLAQLAYLAYLPIAVDRFGHCFSADLMRLVESYGPRIADHLAEMASGHRTFTHGDFRAANLFFGTTGPDDCVAIDWQACGMHNGLRDVSYFLSTSVSTEVRREIERETLAEYHDTLRANGVVGYTLAECWRDYRQVMLSCLIGPVLTCGALDLTHDENYRTMETGLLRTFAAIEELGAAEFLPNRQRWFSVSGTFSALSGGAYSLYRALR